MFIAVTWGLIVFDLRQVLSWGSLARVTALLRQAPALVVALEDDFRPPLAIDGPQGAVAVNGDHRCSDPIVLEFCSVASPRLRQDSDWVALVELRMCLRWKGRCFIRNKVLQEQTAAPWGGRCSHVLAGRCRQRDNLKGVHEIKRAETSCNRQLCRPEEVFEVRQGVQRLRALVKDPVNQVQQAAVACFGRRFMGVDTCG